VRESLSLHLERTQMDSYYSADDIANAKGLQFLAVRHFLTDMRRVI
jgi:hypothetical protein